MRARTTPGLRRRESSIHAGPVKATEERSDDGARERSDGLDGAGGEVGTLSQCSHLMVRTCRAASDPVGTCRWLAVDTCTRLAPFGFPPLRVHRQLTMVLC